MKTKLNFKRLPLLISLLILLLLYVNCGGINNNDDDLTKLSGKSTVNLPIEYDLSDVSRALLDEYGVTVTKVIADLTNDVKQYSKQLAYDEATDIASGTISNVLEGTYSLSLKAYQLKDGTDDLVAEGSQANIVVEKNKTTNVNISMSLLIGEGSVVINGSINDNIITNYFQNSKLILVGESIGEFNTSLILSDANISAILNDGNIYWDKIIVRPSAWGTHVGDKGLMNLTIRTLIDENNNMYIGAIDGDEEEQLKLLLYGSMFNYLDFNGSVLSSDIYDTPMNGQTALNIKHNFLGRAIMWDDYGLYGYKYLYNNGYVISGPQNSNDFYNKNYILYNNYSSDITVASSYLFHAQMDFGSYSTMSVDNYVNSIWSPIANTPDQNTNLARSFDVSITDSPLYSSLAISAYTDNGMASSTKIYGLNSAIDYTDSGSQSGWGSWAINYDSTNETYTASNSSCARAMVFLKHQYPNKVEMSGNTTWSTYSDAFTIAIVGGQISFSNVQESPSPGDNSNPDPFLLIIDTGANYNNREL